MAIESRTINLNNTFKPTLTQDERLEDSITGISIKILCKHRFVITFTGSKLPLCFNVTNQKPKFGKDAKNIWKVKNISQDQPVNIKIVDDQIRSLHGKVNDYSLLAPFSLAWCVTSALGMLILTAKVLHKAFHNDYNLVSIFKSSPFVRNASLAAGLLSIVSIVAGVAYAKFSKTHADAQANAKFDLYNRLISMVSFAQNKDRVIKVTDFNGPLIFQK